MNLSCLVCNDFIAIDLQDGAGRALPCLWVVEGGHTALEGQKASAQRCGVRFSLERGGGCAVQCGLVGVVVEAVWLRCECRLDAADAYV